MRRVEVGFFSFTEVPADAHVAYDEWHRLDHLPEQYALDGIAFGARWVATAACKAVRLAADEPLARAQHVTLYLMTEPVEATLSAFRDLAAELRSADRFFDRREAVRFGAWRVGTQAVAPSVPVRAEVLPWRPSAGVFVLVEQGPADLAPLLEVPGVAGGWTFDRDEALAHPSWRQDAAVITVLWLDDDPAAVTSGLAPVLRARWGDGAVRPLLATPLLPASAATAAELARQAS